MIFQVPDLLIGDKFRFVQTVSPAMPRAESIMTFNSELPCKILYKSQAHPEVTVSELLGGDIRINPGYTDIQLALCTDNSSTVNYQNLMFGFKWFDGLTVIAEKQWPPSNTKYVQSDQRWLVTERVTHLPDKAYRLWVWLTDHGELFEHDWNIITPRPTRPYASWTWDGATWQPPVPFPSEEPDMGFFWSWDEDTLTWVQVAD